MSDLVLLLPSTRRGVSLIGFPLLLFLLLVSHLHSKALAQQQVDQNVGTKNHIFANKLYQVISEENSKGTLNNLIFSPLSLEIVLALAGYGSRGNTKNQISYGIGLSLELESLKSRFAPLIFGIKDDSGSILHVATQLFVEKNYPLKDEFVQASADGFSSGIQAVEFVSNPELALQTVNTWAEQKTDGLIKDLLDIDAITPTTKLILANAVYFKGKWAYPFDPKFTLKQKFYLADGNEVQVWMISTQNNFRYGQPDGLNAKVLELPYQDDRLSMVILLPDSSSSLADLEGKVSAEDFDLDGLISNHTNPVDVFVSLPKFKLELTLKLKAPLKKLGMTEMFTDDADFSGITASPIGLKVSKVVQKAYIEVTEEGTEAAAATGVIFVDRVASQGHRFVANHPFIFFLKEKSTGIVVFSGRVHNPLD